MALIMAVAISVFSSLTPARAASSTLYVNNTNFGPQGTCLLGEDAYDPSVLANNVCSLGAALTYANANSTSAAPFTITLATGFAASITDIAMIQPTTTTANWMTTTNVNPLSGPNGAYYTVTAPMTIDLQNKLGINWITSQDGTTIYINASGVTLKNASEIRNAMSSIVIGGASSDVTIDGGTTMPLDGYHIQQFLVIQNGAQNVTFQNYTLGNLYNGADDGCASAAVCFHPGLAATSAQTTKNVTVDNVTFTTTHDPMSSVYLCDGTHGEGCVYDVFDFFSTAVTIDGLDIGHSAFTNLKKGQDGDVTIFSGYAGWSPTLSNLDFHDNTITDSGSCTTLTTNYCTLIMLPQNKVMGGVNYVRNNVFTDQTSLNQPHAITYDGVNRDTTPSNLFIQDNYFNGFTGPAIWLTEAGTTTVRRNTFGPNTYSNTTVPNSIGEETGSNAVGATGAMFVNNGSGSNQKINTWYPVSTALARANGICQLTVGVQAPGANIPAPPVDIDVYWTATNKAEVYLGTQSNVAGTSVKVPVPASLLSADGTLSGNIRLQTQSNAYAQPQSSQYSRTIAAPTDSCQPVEFTVDKIAYADQARTQELAPGSVQPIGSTVYFTYVLTNKSATASTVVSSVVDSDKGETPVCQDVTLAPAQVDSTSCQWQRTVTR